MQFEDFSLQFPTGQNNGSVLLHEYCTECSIDFLRLLTCMVLCVCFRAAAE